MVTAFDLSAEEVQAMLDARFGRPADDLSFIKGGPTSQEAIEDHIMVRLANRGWRKWFEVAIGELKIRDTV